MGDWVTIFWLTWFAGLAMVVGALIASVEHISNRWLEKELRHTVIAFGGGILISAVSMVLVYEGIKHQPPFLAGLYFGLGGAAFMLIDLYLNKKKESFSQLAAMLLDFIPEVVALGALYLLDKRYALLLALLIITQNIPEGFNAYRELRTFSHVTKWKIIFTFFLFSFLGPITGLIGYFFLYEFHSLIAAIMLFASGGILYLVFQDIAPQAKLERHWAPSLGAVAGFLFGMVGKMLIFHM